MRKKSIMYLVGAAIAGIAAGAVAMPAAAEEVSSEDPVSKDLATVRNVTAKYQDEAVAIADGYVRAHECVSGPAGAMGYHYINWDLLEEGMNLRKPPILLYAPRGDGDGRNLVGVEYFKADEDQDLTTDGDRPSMFDTPFDGPMAGHEPGMPAHYDLHVWVWRENPNGIFAQYNPDVRC